MENNTVFGAAGVEVAAGGDVFQFDERLQYWVPGHQLRAVVAASNKTGVRHQSSGMGADDGGVSVVDQCVSDRAVDSDLFRAAV